MAKDKKSKMQQPKVASQAEIDAANKQQEAQPASDQAPTGDAEKEADIGDIGKNTKGGKRGPTGARTGDAMGAKPKVRQLMGTSREDGTFPSFTVEELCAETKKSDVNIRTILSDLRSPKYCGAGGVFMTKSYKKDGKTYYTFGDVPAPEVKKEEAPAA